MSTKHPFMDLPEYCPSCGSRVTDVTSTRERKMPLCAICEAPLTGHVELDETEVDLGE